jgi:predicted nucleic acid-binding protein
VTPVVIDASAGVELVADTVPVPRSARAAASRCRPWVPETFFVEVGSVLRRRDLNATLTPDQMNDAVRQLAAWPLRVVQVRSLFAAAWRLRKNLTFADDHKVGNAPALSVGALRLPIT